MDDFVILHDDKDFLWFAKEAVVRYLSGLKLCLNENKCRIFKAEQGTPFLGMHIFPNKRRIKKQNLLRFKRRLKQFQKQYAEGKLEWPHIIQSIQSWIGHAAHADTARLRNNLLPEAVFRRRKGG